MTSSAAASIFGLVEDALGEAAGSLEAMIFSMVNPVPLLMGTVVTEVGATFGDKEGLDTGVVGRGGMN